MLKGELIGNVVSHAISEGLSRALLHQLRLGEALAWTQRDDQRVTGVA